MKHTILLTLILAVNVIHAQDHSAVIFSHNDYLQPNPFEDAYNLKVGYVEADVFLTHGELMVAHTSAEIDGKKNLRSLYLDPLKSKIISNNGSVFPEKGRTLTLMIDLKSEGTSTLNAIVDQLKNYPELTACKTLTIAISGDVPDTSLWKSYPTFISFDGRPNRNYSAAHLMRISFISDNFRNYSTWRGEGKISDADKKKLRKVIESVHNQKKKIRFWGAPDVPRSWDFYQELQIDILSTDKIDKLDLHLRKISNID